MRSTDRQPLQAAARSIEYKEGGAALFETLASAKSLQEAVEIRTEYTKTDYETFVAEKRIAEMYNELFKIALKPLGAMIARTPSEAIDK
jgi:hypothetical protein